MISTWMNDLFLIIQNVATIFGGKLDFSNASNSALIAVISF